jgi:hypothetical protein
LPSIAGQGCERFGGAEKDLSGYIGPKSDIQQRTFAYTEGAAIRGNCIGIEDNTLGMKDQRMGTVKQVKRLVRLVNHEPCSARRFHDHACLQGEADVLAALPTKG